MNRSVLLVVFFAVSLCAANKVDSSTLDRKVLIGYQGWFTCPSDGTGRWTHWSRGVPTPESLTVELFPDLSELTTDERCEVPGMTIAGKPAFLFSSRNSKTVSRHFQWMKQYGLDGVLVQRFVGEIAFKERDHDVVLRNIMAAAAESGRTFAIEYDISGSDPATFAQTIEGDWRYLVDEVKVTAHPNYQRHAGKPVVSIWGIGLNDSDAHPPTDPQAALELIRWFKSGAPAKYQVTYMGGTPAHWSTLNADSRSDPGWATVYATMDVLQPWNVGRYASLAGVDQWKDAVIAPDIKAAAANHQLYMPVVFPGFSWHNLIRTAKENQIPRLAGQFLWRQAYNAKIAGATVLKIAMFDEVDEGTAIFKTASHRNQAPDQGYWLTLDADGDDLPGDWYLKIAGQITRMFHNEIKPTATLAPEAINKTHPKRSNALATQTLSSRNRAAAVESRRPLISARASVSAAAEPEPSGEREYWAAARALAHPAESEQAYSDPATENSESPVYSDPAMEPEAHPDYSVPDSEYSVADQAPLVASARASPAAKESIQFEVS